MKHKRVNFFVMMNMSVLAALAGMIFVARSAASGPQDGNGWELDAIAAVFIGGAAVSGGIGTISGSIVGGLVMALLNNGLQLIGAGTDRSRSSRVWSCCSPSRSTSTTRARVASRSSACVLADASRLDPGLDGDPSVAPTRNQTSRHGRRPQSG